MTEINSIFCDAFDSLAVIRRTHASQETKRTDIDAEDWFDRLAELTDDAENLAVAAGYNQQVRHSSKLRHRIAQ